MSFTNQTTNYGLPQWIGTDKPTYLVDQNGAYQTIDTELYNANSNAATAVSSAASAVEVAGTAATNAQTAIDSAATANTNANNAVATANTAITNAAAATATANSALSQVTDLNTVTLDTHTFATTTYADILKTIGTAINNEISDYPFADYEYVLEVNHDDTEIWHMSLDTYLPTGVMIGMNNPSFQHLDLIAIYLSGNDAHWSEYAFSTSTFSSKDATTITNVTTKLYVRKR